MGTQIPAVPTPHLSSAVAACGDRPLTNPRTVRELLLHTWLGGEIASCEEGRGGPRTSGGPFANRGETSGELRHQASGIRTVSCGTAVEATACHADIPYCGALD